MASIFRKKGDDDGAFEYTKKALDIAHDLFDEDHLEIAPIYCSYAEMLFVRNKIPEAFDYHSKALKLRQDNLGENHNDTAESYYKVGKVYESMNDIKNSDECYEKCCKANKNACGTYGEKIADSFRNWFGPTSNIFWEIKAAELYGKAADIKKELGSNVDAARAYHSGAMTHLRLRDNEKALDFFCKAIALNCGDLDIYKANKGDFCWKWGKQVEDEATGQSGYLSALNKYKDAEQMKEQIGKWEDVIAINYDLGRATGQAYCLNDATQYFSKAVNLAVSKLGEKTLTTGIAYGKRADHYSSMALATEANWDYPKSYEILKTLLGEDHADTQEIFKKMKESSKYKSA